jgi:N6-adenosine-specific RNA methylase IME4
VNETCSSFLNSHRFFAERNKYSSKPLKAHELVEQQPPGLRLELFSRANRMGWDTWGDEAQCDRQLDDYGTE